MRVGSYKSLLDGRVTVYRFSKAFYEAWVSRSPSMNTRARSEDVAVGRLIRLHGKRIVERIYHDAGHGMGIACE